MVVDLVLVIISIVVSGLSWVIVLIVVLELEMFVVLNWVSRILSVKINSIVSGIEIMIVGKNLICMMN